MVGKGVEARTGPSLVAIVEVRGLESVVPRHY